MALRRITIEDGVIRPAPHTQTQGNRERNDAANKSTQGDAMSRVFGQFRRMTVMAAVVAAALGALFASQTQAHAMSINPPPSQGDCIPAYNCP